jgi:hypothetical protein
MLFSILYYTLVSAVITVAISFLYIGIRTLCRILCVRHVKASDVYRLAKKYGFKENILFSDIDRLQILKDDTFLSELMKLRREKIFEDTLNIVSEQIIESIISKKGSFSASLGKTFEKNDKTRFRSDLYHLYDLKDFLEYAKQNIKKENFDNEFEFDFQGSMTRNHVYVVVKNIKG